MSIQEFLFEFLNAVSINESVKVILKVLVDDLRKVFGIGLKLFGK